MDKSKAIEILKLLKKDYLTIDEGQRLIAGLVKYVDKYKNDSNEKTQAIVKTITDAFNKFEGSKKELLANIKKESESSKDYTKQEISKALDEMETLLKKARTFRDGKDGKDGRDGVDGIDGKDGSPDTPDEVVKKVKESSLLIPKEKIEGLSDIERIAKANLYTGVSETRVLELIRTNSSSSSGGGGTWGSITGTLSDQTDLQSALDAKAPTTSPTFATSITGSYLTASTILITDGSKNIISASTSTYPSLTELSYVKGVTSAIQTQLDTKIDGSGAATRIAYWSDSNTLTSNSSFTFDGNQLLVGGATGSVGYQGIGLRLNNTTAGTHVVLSVLDGGNSLYLVDSTGAATSLTLGTRGNPADGSQFVAASGQWYISSGKFVVNRTGWSGVAQNEVFSTTLPQQGLFYDTSNYLSTTINSTGSATFNLTGTSPEFTFSDPVNISGLLALGANNLTMTGSIASTGSRVTKIWATDGEFTNMPTVGGTSLSSTFATIASPTFTGEVTIPNTGLHILDTNATHDLIIKPGSNLSSDRTFTITTGDTDMIVDFTAVTDEYVLAYDSGTNTWRGVVAAGGSQTPWTSNINADGYTLYGNDSASGNLTLSSTSDATKGKILFGTSSAYHETNNRLTVGTATDLGYTLGVSGTLNATQGVNFATASGNVTFGSTLNTGQVVFGVKQSTNTGLGWLFGYDSSSTNGFYIYSNESTLSPNLNVYAGATLLMSAYGTGTTGVVINETGADKDFRVESDGDANNLFSDGGANRIGIGTNAPSAKLHTIAITEQLRLGYDTSNYLSTTINSTGSATFDLTGTSPEFTFSDPVNVPDDAYDATSWNGSTEVPTKNAIRDKIESITGGLMPWTEVTGTSQSASVGNGYITNNAGLVTVTLPTTAAVGSIVRVAGKGAGGWKVAQNASEVIHFGNVDTTTGTGGSLASTDTNDAVELLCIVADTEWMVLSSQGNITIV